MVWACIIRAAMQDNFSLLMPGEDREINHVFFTKVIWFHLGQSYSSGLVEMTVVLHDIPKGQVKISFVPRVWTAKSWCVWAFSRLTLNLLGLFIAHDNLRSLMCCFTYSRAHKTSRSSNSYWLESKSFKPLMGELFYTYPLQWKLVQKYSSCNNPSWVHLKKLGFSPILLWSATSANAVWCFGSLREIWIFKTLHWISPSWFYSSSY